MCFTVVAYNMSKHSKSLLMFQFCVKVAAGEGICLFGESSTGLQRMRNCKFSNIESSSVSSVTIRLLPLELGLHTINFTLYTGRDSEILVKTLRVVVRSKPFLELILISDKCGWNKWLIFMQIYSYGYILLLLNPDAICNLFVLKKCPSFSWVL